MEKMANRLPVGVGSRGGQWHKPEYRNAYQRAWRRAHGEYREREALRKARERARARGEDPTRIVDHPKFPRPLPVATIRCGCNACKCSNDVPVVACGMCLEGMHE